jgi:hypothetical protein
MLTSVFDPSARKSLFDILTLSVRLSRLSSSCSFRHQHHDGYFSVYNFGLGLFKKEGSELSEFFKRELSVKMGDDYHFEVSWHLGKKGGGRIYKRGTFWDIYNVLDFMSSYVAVIDCHVRQHLFIQFQYVAFPFSVFPHRYLYAIFFVVFF